MSSDQTKQPELEVSERAFVIAQLRKVLKDLMELEVLHGVPMLLTREDLLRQGLTENAIDNIQRLLSYFTDPSVNARHVFNSIEKAEAAAVQQLADMVAEARIGQRNSTP